MTIRYAGTFPDLMHEFGLALKGQAGTILDQIAHQPQYDEPQSCEEIIDEAESKTMERLQDDLAAN